MGPAERADAIIDFSQYAGKTLILYNDSPAPVPAGDPRLDYYTGDPDQSAVGGAPSTKPGFGPNTRTIIQIKVTGTTNGTAYDPTPLFTALPAAYAATQEKPVVGESVYNAAFGTNSVDNYARINTGSAQSPYFTFTDLTNSQGVAGLTRGAGGSGYTSAPAVTITGGGGTGAAATASINVGGFRVTNGGSGYPSTTKVTISPPPLVQGAVQATATAQVTNGVITGITITNPGASYTTTPTVSFAPAHPTGATLATAVFTGGSVTGLTVTSHGYGYTSLPTVSISGGGGAGAAATATALSSLLSLPLLPKTIQELFELDRPDERHPGHRAAIHRRRTSRRRCLGGISIRRRRSSPMARPRSGRSPITASIPTPSTSTCSTSR